VERAAKSGWDKAAVIVQAVGAFAIFISLAGLFIGIRQFNEQQTVNAAQLTDQQNETTLDEYLDDMSTLVLTYNLASPKSSVPVRAIAIARTLTAVRDLDGERKAALVRFLWESKLIIAPQPILRLYGANLDGTDFGNASLYGAYLSQLGLAAANLAGGDLRGADLDGSNLVGANLSDANLSCLDQSLCADLSDAYLMRADLAGANLDGADLAGAYLYGVNLTQADLDGADLKGALYNLRPIEALNAQGQIVTDMPTRWPQGFDSKEAGATCGSYC
jgi:hypothetical protein